MILQTNLLYEIEISIHNLCWSMTAQHANQESDDALHDKRITIGSKDELTIYIFTLQPNTTLTTVDKVLLVLIFLFERSQLIAQINEHLILVHPVGKILELLNYFILQIINCCHYFISLISFTVINL